MPCTPVSQACDPDGELTPGEGADDKKKNVAEKKNACGELTTSPAPQSACASLEPGL